MDLIEELDFIQEFDVVENVEIETISVSQLRDAESIETELCSMYNDNKSESSESDLWCSSATESASENETRIKIKKKAKHTRKKRHVSDKSTWKRNASALDREQGKDYIGLRKNKNVEENKNEYVTVLRQGKKLLSSCQCRSKNVHCNQITEEMRESIFKKFWEMSWECKRFYVCQRMEMYDTQRKRHRKNNDISRRSYTYKYSFEYDGKVYSVCQKMFVNTLNLPAWTMQSWKQKQRKENISPNTSVIRANESISERRQNLQTFLKNLPRTESHYCRKDTKKLFLEPIWVYKSDLFAFYEKEMEKEGKMPMSITIFNEEFDNLNLSLFTRRKDECEKCMSFRQGNGDEESYKTHLLQQTSAQQAKLDDKNDPNLEIFTIDMQSTLMAPLNNSSSMFYKKKLVVHNLTMYNLKTHAGYCYIWNETEADLSANVFASLYYHFIKTYVVPTMDKNRELVLYSDGCGYQNRNCVLTNALVNCALEFEIVIHQKYLVSGHTMMECDSMHSAIESFAKKKEINVPADYIPICRGARKCKDFGPYTVTYCSHSFFKSFESIKNYKSIRPGLNKVNEVSGYKYNGKTGKVSYKLSHSGSYEELPSRECNITFVFIPFDELPALFNAQLPITKSKFDDLQALKRSIPPDYHSFYDNLPNYGPKKDVKSTEAEEEDVDDPLPKKTKVSKTKAQKKKKSTELPLTENPTKPPNTRPKRVLK